MKKEKVSSLNGNALIWAVCRALGYGPVVAATGISYRSDHGSWVYPRFLEDSEAGELIVSELVSVERPSKGQSVPMWRTVTDNKAKRSPAIFQPVVDACGETLGCAVCRVIVKSYLGDSVEIPDVLLDDRVPA